MVILIAHKSTRAFKIYRSYTLYLRHSTCILRTNKCVFLPHSMELLVSQLVKKWLALYGIRKFITVFTTAPHMSLFLSHISRVHAFQSYFLNTYLNIIFASMTWYFKCSIFNRLYHPKAVCIESVSFYISSLYTKTFNNLNNISIKYPVGNK